MPAVAGNSPRSYLCVFCGSVGRSVGSRRINGIGKSDLRSLESREGESGGDFQTGPPRDTIAILFPMQENASIIAQARDAPACDDARRVSRLTLKFRACAGDNEYSMQPKTVRSNSIIRFDYRALLITSRDRPRRKYPAASRSGRSSRSDS